MFQPSQIMFDGNALPGELCNNIRQAFHEDTGGQIDGILGTGKCVPERKKTVDLMIGQRAKVKPDPWSDLDAALFQSIKKSFTKYREGAPGFQHMVGDLVDTGYQLGWYTKNQGLFAPHVDAFDAASSIRIVGGIFYLNTVDEGGETIFPHWDIRIKPKIGGGIWFPAGFSHVHEGAIPTSGDKYIITTFMLFKSE